MIKNNSTKINKKELLDKVIILERSLENRTTQIHVIKKLYIELKKEYKRESNMWWDIMFKHEEKIYKLEARVGRLKKQNKRLKKG